MANTGVEAPETEVTSKLRWISMTCVILIAGAIFNLAFNTCLPFAGPQPFHIIADDSLMLVRYADNVLEHGTLAWNPGGPATYGLTSPYYFLSVVLPISKFVTRSPIALGVWSSLTCGVLFLCAIPVMIYRFLPGPNLGKTLAIASVFVSLAWSGPDFVAHLIGGMDALFGILYFTIYICFLSWHWRKRTWVSGSIAGFIGGLAFGARPDLLIYAILIPLVAAYVAERRDRRNLLVMLAVTTLTIIGQMLIAYSYFRSPLPLSFYAKSLKLYPGLAGYGFTSLYSLLFFVQSYWLLFLLIIANAALAWSRWRMGASGLEKGLTVGLLAHAGYLLVGLTPIMGQHQRFNYADLPAIVFLSASATIKMWTRLRPSAMLSLGLLPSKYQTLIFVVAILALLPKVTNIQPLAYLVGGDFASLDLTQEYLAYEKPFWFGLDGFTSLPDDLEIGATEIGHVAAMNLHKRVIDFSGLNETRFAHHPFSSQELFRVYAPDLIYMPHPGYRGMVKDIEDDPVFKGDYVWLQPQDTGGFGTGIAIRKNSKYYVGMRDVLVKACSGVVAGRCDLSKMFP